MTDNEHSHETQHDEHADHGHGGIRKYLIVFGALCVLTAISFAIGNSTLAPQVAWISMMAVSCAKAMLVMLFFMHLIWEANWKYVLTIPATVMSVFLVLMLVPDIAHRTDHYHPSRWLHAAEPPPAEHDHEQQSADESELPEGATDDH